MGCTASSDKSSLELRQWKLYLQSMKAGDYGKAHESASKLIELNVQAWKALNSIPLDKASAAMRGHLTSLHPGCSDLEDHVETFFRIREKKIRKDDEDERCAHVIVRCAIAEQEKTVAEQAKIATDVADLNFRLMMLKRNSP